MNRFGTNLRHAMTTAARATAAAFVWAGGKVATGLSMVPVFLGHLLWLIEAKYRDLIDKGYKANSAAYACLKLLATAVPEPPLIAYNRTSEGEAGDALPWTHPLRLHTRQPNPLMTEYEYWELITLHVGAVGRSVWWKERDNAGRLLWEWPLRPDRVGPVYGSPDDGVGADAVLAGWSYQIPGTSNFVFIPRKDAVVYNLPDPMGESGGIVEGVGPLQVLAMEIGADNEATRYVGNLLANDARPGIVLKVKGKITSKEDADLLKQAFRMEYGGNRRGLPGIVDADTEVSSVGFNLKDLEFPSLRRISESRICAAFGVPAILVGLLVGLEAGIRATIAEQREFFAETTLANYWRRFSDQYTNDIASEFGVEIVCLFDTTKVKALVAQAVTKLNQVRDAYDRGVVTPNEYRDALNLPAHTDGDFLPAAQKPQLALAPAPEDGTNPAAVPPAMSPNGKAAHTGDVPLVHAA